MTVTYQICENCVMDTTDPDIKFGDDGVCEYCKNFSENIKDRWENDQNSHHAVEKLAQNKKK